MINHKEILRLKSLGLTHREIADSAGCGRNTVTRTLARAWEQQLSWKQVQLEAYLFVAVLPYHRLRLYRGLPGHKAGGLDCWPCQRLPVFWWRYPQPHTGQPQDRCTQELPDGNGTQQVLPGDGRALRHRHSSGTSPPGSHWGRKDLLGLRPWHGCQPQLLLRAVHPSAGSAGGDFRGQGQRHLPGLHEKAEERELLILDEWLLYPLKEAEARDVLELVEARNKVASTIFCSQYDTSEWHENLYDPRGRSSSTGGRQRSG